MAKVLFSYGVKSAFDALSPKDQNTLYFITDKQMLYKGETLIADKTNLNVAFVTSTPTAETAAEGILYVVTVDGKTTLQTKIAGAVVQVGGGEATQIADGVITITLKYTETGASVITGLRRVSKPGLRIYSSCEDLPKVLRGIGTAIISTSKGVMTDKKARKENVGGEVLAYVW